MVYSYIKITYNNKKMNYMKQYEGLILIILSKRSQVKKKYILYDSIYIKSNSKTKYE